MLLFNQLKTDIRTAVKAYKNDYILFPNTHVKQADWLLILTNCTPLSSISVDLRQNPLFNNSGETSCTEEEIKINSSEELIKLSTEKTSLVEKKIESTAEY